MRIVGRILRAVARLAAIACFAYAAYQIGVAIVGPRRATPPDLGAIGYGGRLASSRSSRGRPDLREAWAAADELEAWRRAAGGTYLNERGQPTVALTGRIEGRAGAETVRLAVDSPAAGDGSGAAMPRDVAGDVIRAMLEEARDG